MPRGIKKPPGLRQPGRRQQPAGGQQPGRRQQSAGGQQTGRQNVPRAEEVASRSAADILQVVATFGSPLALVVAVFFYFGWVRTEVQANELGYDTAILELSTTDYLMRNINGLFFPLILLVVLSLAAHSLHQRLMARNATPSRHAVLLRAARLLGWSWLLWGVLGVVLVVVTPSSIGLFVLPLSMTLALLCALYGRALVKRITGAEPWSPARKVFVLVLLAFVVFWDTERVARILGEGYAAQIAANPQELSAVTVYSTRSLALDASGVVETELGTADSEYHYRYEGLRLLNRSGERYILINERWDSRQGRVIVLRETDGIRMEFRQ